MSEFLKNLAEKIDRQDNLATATPYLVVVQSLEMIGVVDQDYFYCSSDDGKVIMTAQNAESDYDEGNEIVLPILYKWVDKNWFFTQEAAKKHIEANHYHYKEPRTYIKYCFRNPEMEGLFEEMGVKR